MSGLPLPITADVMPSSSSEHVVKLIWQKLASTEAEVAKLKSLLAGKDSSMEHIHLCSTDFTSGDTSLTVSNDRKWNTISPVLADIIDTDANQGALVSRICRLESVVTSFRRTVARLLRERDYWRCEKLSSDERCICVADSFKAEITRLHKEAEDKCCEATEAKMKLEKSAEQLQSDLMMSLSSLVCKVTCGVMYIIGLCCVDTAKRVFDGMFICVSGKVTIWEMTIYRCMFVCDCLCC